MSSDWTIEYIKNATTEILLSDGAWVQDRILNPPEYDIHAIMSVHPIEYPSLLKQINEELNNRFLVEIIDMKNRVY